MANQSSKNPFRTAIQSCSKPVELNVSAPKKHTSSYALQKLEKKQKLLANKVGEISEMLSQYEDFIKSLNGQGEDIEILCRNGEIFEENIQSLKTDYADLKKIMSTCYSNANSAYIFLTDAQKESNLQLTLARKKTESLEEHIAELLKLIHSRAEHESAMETRIENLERLVSQLSVPEQIHPAMVEQIPLPEPDTEDWLRSIMMHQKLFDLNPIVPVKRKVPEQTTFVPVDEVQEKPLIVFNESEIINVILSSSEEEVLAFGAVSETEIDDGEYETDRPNKKTKREYPTSYEKNLLLKWIKENDMFGMCYPKRDFLNQMEQILNDKRSTIGFSTLGMVWNFLELFFPGCLSQKIVSKRSVVVFADAEDFGQRSNY